MQKVLKKEGEKVKLEMHQMLHGDDGEDVNGDGRPGDEVSKKDDPFWMRFAEQKAKEDEHAAGNEGKYGGKDGGSWASLAENTRKAVRRLVRFIPEESD